MRHLLSILTFLCIFSSIADAQTGVNGLPLPPSMQAELKQQRAKIVKTVVFRDTVKGASRAREFMDDTTKPEGYVPPDSALATVDSGVSLTHKEWLDSQVVELPEISHFGTKIHFSYPLDIMTETLREPVPFDTSLVALMNPVTKENLPYFDQSPIPLPLTPGKSFEAFAEAGGGSTSLPHLRIGGGVTTSERFGIDLLAEFDKGAGDYPVNLFYNINPRATLMIGNGDIGTPFHNSILSLDLGLNGKETDLYLGSDSATTHTLSNLGVGVRFFGDQTEKVHYDASVKYNSFNDNYNGSLTESTVGADLAVTHHVIDWAVDIDLAARYEQSSDLSLRVPSFLQTDNSKPTSISAQHYSLAVGQKNQPNFDWLLGASFQAASDGSGNRTSVLPFARIRVPLNPRWEIGAAFEPQIALMNASKLAAINPFFATNYSLALQDTQASFITSTLDPRRAAIEKANVVAFMNYQLWADDEIRTSIRFIEREMEPVFFERKQSDGTSGFYIEPKTVRRLIATAGANFLLFTRDVVSATFEYHSATISGEDIAVPFEPTLSLSTTYHFNSLASWLKPRVEFNTLSRKDHSVSFLNAEVYSELTPKIAILVRLENLLGSPSDFWTSYNERPRSVLGTLRYRF